MPQEMPRLMTIPADDQTQKPDRLVDQPIVLLNVENVNRRDGQGVAQRWTVRHADQTIGLYWAPGTWPPIIASDWFTTHPGLPLHCMLTQEEMRPGMKRWNLIQRDPDPVDANGRTPTDKIEEELPF